MKKSLLFLIGIFVYSLLPAQSLPRFVTDSLDAYCLRGMKDWKIPGMAVAIVKDGKVVFMKGYGVREVGKPAPVDENTLFMIGSNTKAFTATAITILETEKKLSLDDKVTQYVPSFKLDNQLAGQQATITDLLCHRIGFETFQGDFTYWASNLTRKEVVEKMSHVKALYGFRAKWGYCNAAFVTAGEVVEAASGQPWENYIREKILKPLKMDRTQMLAAEFSTAENIAQPYVIENHQLLKIPVGKIDNIAPAGTIGSSVSDMSHWLIAQLDNGKYDGQQVIPAAAVAKTHVAQSIIGMNGGDKVNSHFYLYGLGFFIGDRAGKVMVAHTGGVDGFLSSVVLIPEDKLGIVVLTNTLHNNLFQDLTSEIRDAFLGLPYTGFSQNSLKRRNANEMKADKKTDSLKAVVAKKNKPVMNLSHFTGNFTNDLYGDVAVVQKGDLLEIHFSHHPTLIGKLELLEGSTFLCTYSSPIYGVKETPFKVENGKVTGFTLHVDDFIEFTPYEFVRK